MALTEEVTRDMWGWRWIRDLLQDVRYGLRMLRLNPGFTTVAILTLALGIGANTAIFSLIDTVMLRMLPVQNPEELLQVATFDPQSNGELNPYYTNPLWEQIRDHQDVFSSLFAWSPTRFDLSQGGESHEVNALYVSGDFFHTLGVPPAAGRLLTNSDDMRGCPGTVVLSYGFWQQHYGGVPNAVGSLLSLNGNSFEVIGVTVPGFFGVNVGNKFDVAVPVCTEAIMRGKNSMLDERGAWWLNIIGRPKPGIGQDQVMARLRVLSPGIVSSVIPQNWNADKQQKFIKKLIEVRPAGSGVSGLRRLYHQPLTMLMSVVGLVLLIACANITSLMLARASARRKEIAVRLALGASRSRLIRQLLTECVLLSCAGALLGMLFARWGCTLLLHFISSARSPVFLQLSMDGRILGFTTGIAVLTGLLFGVLPALRSTRVSLSAAMKGGDVEESETRAHARPGRWIVASQVALSLVLLIVAGLFLRSFTNLLEVDAGFDRSNVLLIHADDQKTDVPPDQRAILHQQILDRLKSLPGVISASQSVLTPISEGQWDNNLYVDGGGGPSGNDADAFMNYVSPGYFATLRSPLLAGRDFDNGDTASAPLVGIVNETLVRKYFLQANPIGKYVHLEPDPGQAPKPICIVGIVKDAKYSSLREAAPPTIYFPAAQLKNAFDPTFEIRTASQPSSFVRPAEETITGVNKKISLTFQTLEEQVDDSLRRDKLLATLSGFFGGLALLLATIGLYGVLAYMVTQRRKEIGIRMALGAGRESILWLVLRDVSLLLLAGVTVGVGVSLWATQFLQKMLFDMNARDTKTIIGSVAVLAAVALFAGYLPARRASRLNPMAILRDE